MLWDRTAAMTALALESFTFWTATAKLSDVLAYGFIANEYQESRFDTAAVGDRDAAFGCFQLHWDPRGEAIARGYGIDLRKNPPHAEQLAAALWELTQGAEQHAFSEIRLLNVDLLPEGSYADVFKAGAAVSRWWLRPGQTAAEKVMEMERRGQFAQDWQAAGLSLGWAGAQV